MEIEQRLAALGLTLPGPVTPPESQPVVVPYQWVRVRGQRAYIAAHPPTAPDGRMTGPFGKVGATVSLEEATDAARRVTLSMLGSLQRALGDLDRVTAWLRVFGMVNVAPGFTQLAAVINGCSDLLLDVYGPERGQHARAAVGLAELAFGNAVVIEAEVEIDGPQ